MTKGFRCMKGERWYWMWYLLKGKEEGTLLEEKGKGNLFFFLDFFCGSLREKRVKS